MGASCVLGLWLQRGRDGKNERATSQLPGSGDRCSISLDNWNKILSATNPSARTPTTAHLPRPPTCRHNNNLNYHHPTRPARRDISLPPEHTSFSLPAPAKTVNLLSSTHNHHHYPNSNHALDRTKIRPHKMRLPLLLLFGTACLAADPCTVIITARTGDTCATISSLAGITVSQFLRANPSVSSCAALAAGTRYCVDPGFNTAPSPSSTSARPAATSGGGGGGSGAGLEVSTNGQCGGLLTCLTSPYGDCCSEHGWCGGTSDHCSPPGCQAAYGRCDSPPSNGTTTIYITRMTTVISTVPGTGVGAGVTQIVRSTTTVTVPGQTTATVRVTDRSLVLLTSTVTTIKTVTITDARLCRTTTRAGAGAGGVVTRVEGGQGGQGGEGAVLVPRGEEAEGGEDCKFYDGGGGEGGC